MRDRRRAFFAFDSTRKPMTTVDAEGAYLVYTKGGP
jgi:magnesium-transporting ATPase (P-type)